MIGGSKKRESASSKRDCGEESGFVKSKMSLGLEAVISERNWPEQRGHVMLDEFEGSSTVRLHW